MLEDIVADAVELQSTFIGVITEQIALSSPHAFGAVVIARKLVGLSEALTSDAAFVRQLKRKWLRGSLPGALAGGAAAGAGQLPSTDKLVAFYQQKMRE